jgi:pilus assembly protein Flp/PilA
MSGLRVWLAGEGGHTAIEYGLIASLFAVASISAYVALSNSVQTMFNTISTQLTAASVQN